MQRNKLNSINIVKSIFIILFIFITALILYSINTYLSFNPTNLNFSTNSLKIYDTNNTFLWEISKDNAVHNTPISIKDIPENCKQSLVSIEDKTFYENIGIDLNGVVRLFISFFTNGSLGGGSTISQQVVKNYFNNIYNRDPIDKLKEVIYSIKLNSYYSKDQILEMYFNNVYFGELNYGIESASENYFNKNTQELDLAECAYLAGIPQWPGVYNPYGNQSKGKNRQLQVLEAMHRDGKITETELNTAYSEKLNFILNSPEVRAPHFVQYIQDEYHLFKEDNIPEYNTLITTYDYDLHKDVLDLLKTKISEVSKDNKNINNGAIVVLYKDKLLVMIGSSNYFDESINGKFNSALGLRQPANLLKPLFINYLEKTNFGVNESIDFAVKEKYQAFELYLQSFTKNNSNLCDEHFLEEGCEISIFDLSKIYHLLLNGYDIYDLKNNTGYVQDNNNDEELFKVFSAESIEYTNFRYMYSLDKNLKDTFAIATDGEYTIGVWIGNTQGKEISGLNPANTTQPLIKNIIDYINSNGR